MAKIVVAGIEGKVVKRPPFSVIGVKVEAPLSGLAAKMLQARESVRNQMTKGQHTFFSVMPPQNIKSNEDIHLLYVGVEASKLKAGNFTEVAIPAQSYIQFHYEGPTQDCPQFFYEIFSWLQKNDTYKRNPQGTAIEEYGPEHNWSDKTTPDNALTIYVPIL